jgi:photosystem II stability/assembly factor-like uncharacterized protein
MKIFATITMTVLFILGTGEQARADVLACRTLRGPCQFLDSLAVLFPSGSPVLVANFGLVSADPMGQLRFACEASLGGLVARARLAPPGDILVAGDRGLARYRPGCGTPAAFGSIPGQAILDLAIDQQHLWALGASPRAVHHSSDGGARFEARWTFDAGENIFRLVPTARPDTLYAAGERTSDGRFLLLRSDDAGETFQALPAEASPPGVSLDLPGVHPTTPEVLFLALRGSDETDALWRSEDGGRHWAKVLGFPRLELFAAFTFGATGDTVFVASRQPFDDPAAPPAHLYVSHDGGRTFAPGLASPAAGPRYRCLGFRAGVLYACGGGTPNGDSFLLGSSTDEGRTWTALMTAEALAGPEPCREAACAETSRWLCDTYGYCGRDGGPGAAPDGGVARAPGASCGVAGRSRPGSLLLLVFLVTRRRRPSGRRRAAGPDRR